MKKLACSLSGIAHYRRLQCFSAAGCRLASASGVAGMDAAMGTDGRRKTATKKENPSPEKNMDDLP